MGTLLIPDFHQPRPWIELSVNPGRPLALKAYGRHGEQPQISQRKRRAKVFYIHPGYPQQRLINQAVDIVRKGGVIASFNRFRLAF